MCGLTKQGVRWPTLCWQGQLVVGPGLGDLVGRAGCAHASLATDEFLDIVLGDMS